MKKKLYGMLCSIVLLLVFAVSFSISAEASDTIPQTSNFMLPRLIDNAEVLSDQEEMPIKVDLNEISLIQNFDVVIMTVASTDGKEIEQYAEDFYDNNGYGVGEGKDGLIFVVNTQTREWAVSTHGSGITAFTDAGQKYLMDQVTPYLSEENFSDAFEKFADLCESFVKQANSGEPYDTGNLPNADKPVGLGGIIVSIIIGTVLSLLVMAFMWLKMKSVFRKHEASDYIRPGSLVITEREDKFLNSKVIKTAKPKNNQSSGNGTSRSSSGKKHSSSSGKY